MISETHAMNIIGDFFKNKGFVHHQTESFDNFINIGIQNVVKGEEIVVSQKKGQKYSVRFNQVYIPSPTITEEDRTVRNIFPSEVRQRNLTYDSPIYVDIIETLEEEERETEVTYHERIKIGRIPIMLRSEKCNLYNCTKEERIRAGECEYDQGGYFIIKGNERVLVGQIRGIYNKPLVLQQKPGEKFKYVCEIRSMSEETAHSVLVQVKIGVDDRTIVFSLPYIKEHIPVGIVLKALGFTTEKEILNLIGIEGELVEKYLKFIIRDSYFIETQEQALEYIGQFTFHIVKDETRVVYSWQVVETELFPHLGISATIKEKAFYLGYMINKLLSTTVGLRSCDDRDDYTNKRVEMAGVLCCDLFRTLFKRYIKAITLQLLKKKCPDVMTIITRTNTITLGLKHSFATGNWGVQKNSYIRTGVSQVLTRLTFGATISHLRRMIIPVGKEGKNTKIRQIHSSQVMYVCPSETPEGATIGIVLNISLLTIVSHKILSVLVKEILEKSKNLICINDFNGKNDKVKVLLNGTILGFSEKPDDFVDEVKEFRDKNIINKYISIVYDSIDQEIRIFSDEGRLLRPLFTVEDNHLKITDQDGTNWEDLIERKKIQYLDNSEIENCTIAMNQSDLLNYDNDYCEIHPSMMLGVMASIIPFPDHSQSPRNCYQCLDPNELVVMADGVRKKIGDIKVGDLVVTVDPVTYNQSITTVVNQYVCPTEKIISTFVTESGRYITCTNDHPVLTSSGWKEAAQAHDIGIIPQQEIYIADDIDIDITLPETIVKNKHILTLSQMDLYPVKAKYIPTLARIVGFLLANGFTGIYKNYPQIQITFGNDKGFEYFQKDVEFLGFKRNFVSDIFTGDYYSKQIIYNNEFASLIIGLIGNFIIKSNTEEHPLLPQWIINSSKAVKREFLAGFQGGNGSKFKYNILPKRNNRNFILNSTKKIIILNHVDSLVKFMEQIKNIFNEFGIMCSEPTIRDNKNVLMKTVHIYFLNTEQNLVNYFERIGWRYDHYKYSESLPIYEYLRKCLYSVKQMQIKNLHIELLNKNNISNIEIGNIVNKTESQVSDILKCIKNKTKCMLPTEYITYREWINNTVILDNILFVKIEKYVEQANGYIADISVESSNHSFIAGDSFCVHNSSMGKQAIGMFASSHQVRTDTIVHVLDYPQKPLVSTIPSQFMGFNNMPSGINAIVAIACYSGFNQEDSVIINKSAIDRGLFTVTSYRTLCDEEKKRSTYAYETIKLPPIDKRHHNYNYGFLDENGIIKKRIGKQAVYVNKGDVIIGKILTKSGKDKEEEIVDCSVVIKHGEEGFVDRIIETITPNGYKLIKVVIRNQRIPEVGDKFASRAAQKGTTGHVYSQEDMPFTSDGIIPDIIINPHAIPSRMTVNQLLECILGKTCALKGKFGDATPFSKNSFDIAEKLCEGLKNSGYERHGWEQLYNGFTGELIESKIFIGPTYYQRLKHMVSDKLHARSQGHVTTLTRQPLEGRSRDGGLRFGEMERDCMITHGVSRFLKERLFEKSDPYQVYVCELCGFFATTPKFCKGCNSDKISKCNFPYASKLLQLELNAMGIKTSMTIKK